MAELKKVINGIKCCYPINQTECYKCPYSRGNGCKHALMGDALALLKAQEPRVMTLREAPGVDCWISVKDKLPEDEYECLVIAKDGYYYIGWFKDDIQKWVVDGVVWCEEEVTHWIKLPEPPKKEDDAE